MLLPTRFTFSRNSVFMPWLKTALPSLAAFLPLGAATVSLPDAPGGFQSLPSAPSGFDLGPGTALGTSALGDLILDGLSFATTFSGVYNSNVNQSPGPPLAPVEDDFIATLGASVNYLSTAPHFTFGGNYRASYDSYFSNSDLSGFNQGAGLVANYKGGKLTATLGLGIDFDRGSNRNYASSFVERTNISSSLSARYRLSAKTSLAGNIGQTYTTASGDFSDTESFDAGASALWQYSPLTEFGPGIRYTYRTGSGSSQPGRSSIGPTLNVNYKLSTKVGLTSRVGVDFASYDDGGSADPTFSSSVGLNYRASSLWGMNLSLYRDVQADPSVAGAFSQVTALRVGYNRKIRRVTWNLGMGYETTTTERPGGAGRGAPDRNYFTVDSSLGMALFSNTTSASIFLRYSDQSAGRTQSWDSFQPGFSISRSF